jgi:hypothetical protein
MGYTLEGLEKGIAKIGLSGHSIDGFRRTGQKKRIIIIIRLPYLVWYQWGVLVKTN